MIGWTLRELPCWIAVAEASTESASGEGGYDVVSRVFIPWQVKQCAFSLLQMQCRVQGVRAVATLQHAAHVTNPMQNKPARLLLDAASADLGIADSSNAALPSNPVFVMQGIDEDTATGSAHCIIGPLFADILGKTSGIKCWQCSARGGAMTLDVKRERHMVAVSALACLRSRGSLSLDHATSTWTRT